MVPSQLHFTKSRIRANLWRSLRLDLERCEEEKWKLDISMNIDAAEKQLQFLSQVKSDASATTRALENAYASVHAVREELREWWSREEKTFERSGQVIKTLTLCFLLLSPSHREIKCKQKGKSLTVCGNAPYMFMSSPSGRLTMCSMQAFQAQKDDRWTDG